MLLLVGHLACNSSYLIFQILDIDNSFTEIIISEEGESEEEKEEVEEKDQKEYRELDDTAFLSKNESLISRFRLGFHFLEDDIIREVCPPPPKH